MMKLEFVWKFRPDGHGADDYEKDDGEAYTLIARQNGQTLGRLNLNLPEGEIHVRWTEVKVEYRRQGIATALIREAQRRFPGRDLTTNGFTDDGEPWWDSLTDTEQVSTSP